MPKVNYTEDATAIAKSMYVEGREAGKDNETVLDEIGEKLEKSRKSVRAKLVREGVFDPDPKPDAKPKDEGPTKKELIKNLDDLGVDTSGADGATKDFIKTVIGLANRETD